MGTTYDTYLALLRFNHALLGMPFTATHTLSEKVMEAARSLTEQDTTLDYGSIPHDVIHRMPTDTDMLLVVNCFDFVGNAIAW